MCVLRSLVAAKPARGSRCLDSCDVGASARVFRAAALAQGLGCCVRCRPIVIPRDAKRYFVHELWAEPTRPSRSERPPVVATKLRLTESPSRVAFGHGRALNSTTRVATHAVTPAAVDRRFIAKRALVTTNGELVPRAK